VAGDVGVGGGGDHRGAGLPMARVEQRKTPRGAGLRRSSAVGTTRTFAQKAQ
jgi:hypothetical protein